MRELKVTTHVFPISPGKPGAPIGTREWADWLRLSLVSMVDHIGEEDTHLLSTIEFTREHRAWTLMNKPDGSFFSTIEDFCAFRRPYGLGRSWTNLRPFLVAGMAKRGTPADEIERSLQLEEVPQAMPAAESARKAANARHHRIDEDATGRDVRLQSPASSAGGDATRHDVGSQSPASPADGDATRHDVGSHPLSDNRMAERLRAINRAPESVKHAYREGRISQTLAAKLGPRNPSPDTAAHIADIAAKIRHVPDRKAVDAIVRERLGTQAPTAVDRAVRALERLSREQRSQFFQRVEALRAESVS